MTYQEEYEQSITESDAYWSSVARRLEWMTPPTRSNESTFGRDVSISWFSDGTLNIADNCIDRYARTQPEVPALLWVGDEPGTSRSITYRMLRDEVNRVANVLKSLGVKKGDTVTIYLPMVPEAAYAMLACARIGAVHSVVFAGFSAESLAGRIRDSGSRVVITADEGRRGGKTIPLKQITDEALSKETSADLVIVVRNTGADVPFETGRDHWLHELIVDASTECPSEEMSAEDPLFILYTSGSTGTPKGLVHTTGGYLTYASYTHERVFNYRPGEVYWCTADVGWITGHSYLLYGPLANGATTLMFEGVPTYPSPARLWEIVDEFNVAILYTAPTLIRSLMAAGDQYLEGTKRTTLRILGTVGEPINPEAWQWYFTQVGGGRCPVMDTWWQTETGGFMITPLPDTQPLKPGSAQQPFFGIRPQLIDDAGREVVGEGVGRLVITQSWPGQARGIWGDATRFYETYFKTVPGAYFSGDGARRDADGDYTITGRVDDVVNVSGHRLSTAEVESALASHALVAEAAVVGMPHAIKGQALACFVVLRAGAEATDMLAQELSAQVRTLISAIATPERICFVDTLPKTRSGKIMRRILRHIVAGTTDYGDTSTLIDPQTIGRIERAWG